MPDVYFTRFIEFLLLPPGGPLLLAVLGAVLLALRARRSGWLLLVAGLGYLYLASTPWLAQRLLEPLQARYPAVRSVPPEADVIVVLGGGTTSGPTEFGTEGTLAEQGLERARYAAFLARKAGLPVITTGGDFGGREPAEGALAREVLQGEFGVERVYAETKSTTTHENAVYALEIMQANGWRRPLVVTNYWHMLRAMRSFERLGVQAIAAPTVELKPGSFARGFWRWVPQLENGMRRVRLALHEQIGEGWYALRAWFSAVRPELAGAAAP